MRHNAMSLALRAESPLPCTMPRGAFYAFPRISEWLEELSVRTDFLAEILLDEFGLACLPGTTFGPGGAEHLRLSFATSRSNLQRALDLLRRAAPLGLSQPACSELMQ
jgi:aspartate/methionine/tyrosine aminotransferase